MEEITLDLIKEFVKTQHLEIINQPDKSLKLLPGKFIYKVIDYNVVDDTPAPYFMHVDPLSLIFVHEKTKDEMIFNNKWRKFLMDKDPKLAELIIDEAKSKILFVNNNIYRLSASENQKVREEKISFLNSIIGEVNEFLNSNARKKQ